MAKKKSLEEKHAQYLKGGRWKLNNLSPEEIAFIESEEQTRRQVKKSKKSST